MVKINIINLRNNVKYYMRLYMSTNYYAKFFIKNKITDDWKDYIIMGSLGFSLSKALENPSPSAIPRLST